MLANIPERVLGGHQQVDLLSIAKLGVFVGGDPRPFLRMAFMQIAKLKRERREVVRKMKASRRQIKKLRRKLAQLGE